MRRQRSLVCFVGMGLMLGAAGCDSGNGDGSGGRISRPGALGGNGTNLLRAASCDDLLTKIQEDAITKLDLAVEQYKAQAARARLYGGVINNDGFAGGPIPPTAVAIPRDATASAAPESAPSLGAVSGGTGSATSSSAPTPNSASADDSAGEFKGDVVGASETNTQVKGVDEADFVKLVDSGKGMFLLHGNKLHKLKTLPAAQLALDGAGVEIEGNPSELFVTEGGRAVVFSSVYGYGSSSSYGGKVDPSVGIAYDDVCSPYSCGGGGNYTKITVLDVTSAPFKAVRELYYAGNYVSSRRYDDVVRVVLQAQSSYSGLYSPDVRLYDSFGRPLSDSVLSERLEEWKARVAGEIRTTTLKDWLPLVQEAKGGKLAEVAPNCGAYFVPQPGLSDFGLTHVLSLDVSKSDAAIGGVTIMGQASTVYSSLDRLVLAQPDYRWGSDGDVFGVINEQRTSLHMFELDKAETAYEASGWVPGGLPPNNAQFGIDVTADHTLRIATTGSVRKNPTAARDSNEFWESSVENHVFTLQTKDKELATVGKSENLGHVERGETIQSARFVGDRAYVVTYRQTDPLIVLDVATPTAPAVLGQIEIPGFSQYMHPLDATHLITFGQSGTRGSQLQLFDVSDPSVAIPAPKTLDLGNGAWSEVSNNHKAFTFYAKQSLIALPVSGSKLVPNAGYNRPEASLQVIKVDKDNGFTAVGSVEHGNLYQQQNCLQCSFGSCYFSCGYGGVEMRRGHFVETTETTYVYGISYGGVSVSDLSNVGAPLATVTLPQATGNTGVSWYGTTTSGGNTGSSGSGSATTTSAGSPPVVQPATQAGGGGNLD